MSLKRDTRAKLTRLLAHNDSDTLRARVPVIAGSGID